MARKHAQIFCSIWSDIDFTGMSIEEQRLYLMLMSQRLLNPAGVVPMTLTRWANTSPDTTPDDVLRWLEGLARKRYVVFDPATEEVLVRSFIRRDTAKQPNMFKAALRQVREVDSPLLRQAIAEELRRLPNEGAAETADELFPKGSPTPPEPFAKGLPETPREPIGEGSPKSRVLGEGEGSVRNSPSEVGFVSPSERIDGDAVVLELRVSQAEPTPKARRYPQVFDDAWFAYGRKGTKGNAYAEWQRAVKRAPVEVIVAAIQPYVQATPDMKYRKDFERWLKYDGWESAVVTSRPAVNGHRPWQDRAEADYTDGDL